MLKQILESASENIRVLKKELSLQEYHFKQEMLKHSASQESYKDM